MPVVQWLTVVVCIVFSGSGFADDTRIGNGGRYTAAEFIARGYVIHSYLTQTQTQDHVLSPHDLLRFSQALAKTRVEVLNEQLRDSLGAIVDARTIDDPNLPGQKMIQLNESAWDEILKNHTGVYRLIFHEYLWVLGFDDTNYKISARVKFFPNVSSPTPTTRTCGTEGNLYNRLIDCAKPTEQGGFEELATRMVLVPESDDPLGSFDLPQFFQWRLVTRTADRQQIWLDVGGNIIWTDTDDSGQPYGHPGNPQASVLPYGASNECVNEAVHLKANIVGSFELPTPQQWSDSAKRGLLSVVPNLKGRTFHVRAPRGLRTDAAVQFTEDSFSVIGIAYDARLNYRCVLRVPGIN